ncbi:MAG: hypothetical protein O2782_15590 [bacterium]|nr:hypothetical protein [bacterium]
MRLISLLFTLLVGLLPSALAGQVWTIAATTGPSARHTAAAIYDPVGERIVLFGGRSAAGDHNDVWAFDLHSHDWRQLQPGGAAPMPRFSHNAVYDALGQRMLVWSGRSLDAAGSTLHNDVWALDLRTQQWTQLLAASAAPIARYGTAAVYDPVARELVSFAGFTTQGRFDDTWRFDPAGRIWRDVTLASPQPGERCLHAAAYDSQRHRMIMFGGQRGTAALDDAWALDLATDRWSVLPPAPATGGRKFPAVTYDPSADRFLLFGGETTAGTRGGDLWALDLASQRWSVLTTTGPAPRDGAVLVHVPAQSRLLLFGGATPDGNAGDTWSLVLPGPPTVVRLQPSQLQPSTQQAPQSLQAYPNPFNASVVLELQLTEAGHVTIHDMLGQPVRHLGAARAGTSRRLWDGHDDGGNAVACGVYLAVLQAPSSRQVQRLMLLR